METTTERSAITVRVESEPHNENLEGVLLNSPAPKGGTFLIDQRLPRDVWQQMKNAGAWYWSQDDLEEFDMFNSEAGWRYNLDALKALLANSAYALKVRGQIVVDATQLDALFTPAAIAAYWQQRESEKRAAELVKREAEERKQQEYARAVAEYTAWQAQTLAGLVETFSGPHYSENVQWERIAHFNEGGWYTTGDTWYRTQYDGETVYKCSYGNATKYYASQRTVDLWVEASYARDVAAYGEAQAARQVLYMHSKYPNNDVIFSDISNRLVHLRGEEFFASVARGAVWYHNPYNGGAANLQSIADRYGITLVGLHGVEKARKLKDDYNTLKQVVHPNPPHARTDCHNAQHIWQDADGALYGESYCGEIWMLTDEQITLVAK